MGYYIAIPLLVLCATLQASIIPLTRIASGEINLILLVVIAWAMHARLPEALFWAFAGGIIQDLASVLPTGTSAISLLIIVTLIDTVRQQVYSINIFFILGFALLGTLLQQIILMITLPSIGLTSDIITIIRYVTLPTILYNVGGILPVYILLRLFQRRTSPSEIYATP